jgi:hypothetical protein
MSSISHRLSAKPQCQTSQAVAAFHGESTDSKLSAGRVTRSIAHPAKQAGMKIAAASAKRPIGGLVAITSANDNAA